MESYRELVVGGNKWMTVMNSPWRCQNEISSFERIAALKR